MTDLTAITTPFGLLDRETQEALKAHGGPRERWDGTAWVLSSDVEPCPWISYRVKPAPPKPREWWLVRNATQEEMFQVKDDAVDWESRSQGFCEIIHVREVLP